jgi:hypothetical protein
MKVSGIFPIPPAIIISRRQPTMKTSSSTLVVFIPSAGVEQPGEEEENCGSV